MARLRPLADLVDPCLGEALAAQGFATADIVASWPDIVGERLAAYSRPLKLDWPKRRGGGLDRRPDPASLVVRVESAFAIEMQHLAPVLIDRLNAHYGWRCVGKLVLKQGPVPRPTPPPAPPAPLSPAERARVGAALEGIADEGLRSALESFGRAVVQDGRPRRGRAGPTTKS